MPDDRRTAFLLPSRNEIDALGTSKPHRELTLAALLIPLQT